MPPRKNRPGKSGTQHVVERSDLQLNTSPERYAAEQAAVKHLAIAERETPGGVHFMAWDHVDACDRLQAHGYLVESNARGCYRVTDRWPQAIELYRGSRCL